MRRSPAILLLVAFSFALIAPLLPDAGRAKLPACCRRDGSHGCGMKHRNTVPDETVSAVKATCPAYPSGGAAQAHGMAGTVVLASATSIRPAASAPAPERERTRYGVSSFRSSSERGPPSLHS